MGTAKSKDKYGYKTLRDLAKILSLFSATGAESLGISEIAKSVQMLSSKVSRMLGTLETEGFFEKNEETGKYSLGGRFLELGTQYVYNLPLRHIIRPHLKQIAEELGQSSNFAIFKNTRIIIVDRVQISGSAIGEQSNVANLPLHASSHGKLFLAYLSENEQEELLTARDLTKFTSSTITDVHLMKEELKRIERQGYALDVEEMLAGIVGIAVPIRNKRANLVAALGVPVVRNVSSESEELSRLIKYLKAKALFISQQLGYFGNAV